MNYNSLMNKPTINYKELIGDNTVTEVGGITEEQFNTLLSTDLSSYYTKAQIDDLFSRSYVYREKSGPIVTFDCPSTSQSIPEVTVGIKATQSGSGDPSPTNVRPFTGVSAVNVYDTKKNLFDISTSRYIYARVQSGNTLYIQQNSNTTITLYIAYTDGTATSSVSLPSNTKVTFNVEHNVKEMALSETIYNYLVSNNKNMMVSLQDFDNIEPYNGQTYTIDLDGTRYGGSLDVVSGELVVDRAYYNISDITFSESGNYYRILDNTIPFAKSQFSGDGILSHFNYGEREDCIVGTTPSSGHYIMFYKNKVNALLSISSVADFNAYLVSQKTNGSPVQLVYKLATPLTIQLTPTAISTQDGTNNLWADSGDIEVKCLDRIIPAGE